jgi:metallo-beta-lactamase class B
MIVLRRLLLLFGLFLTLRTAAAAPPNPAWTTPLKPFQITDDLFYVGSRDLAAYLVHTPAGNILINANLESSPPQIRASVEQLGFRWNDIRILLNSQAHYDHMAGAAQVLRETHAKNMVMEGDVDAIATGGVKDFGSNTDGLLPYPPSRVDRVLHDRDTVVLGGVILTAHRTAGHTRGCTTWTLQSHLPGDPAGKLRNVVIVGGMAALNQYRLVGPATAAQPATYPGIANDFRTTFRTLHALPCDIFLGAHGVYFDMLGKLQRLPTVGPSVWVDPAGYQAAVSEAERNFNKMLASQQQP